MVKKRVGKKRSFHIGKVQINFTNKLAYTILSVMILVLAGVVVLAYTTDGSGVPSVMGHSTDEINWSQLISKITVSVIDPVYTIEGVSYATYGHSTIGLKEEVVGKVKLSEGQYVVNFDDEEVGSDLWLFRQITDFGEEWGDLIVSLTPEGRAEVWYELHPEENSLIIFGDHPVKISYRLVAPRFDWTEIATNLFDGELEGLIVR